MKTFTVAEPVFKTATLFVVGCDFERLRQYLRRYHVDPGENVEQLGQMFTFTNRRRAPWRLVWVRDVDLGVVFHETFHLVARICADKGVPIVAHHPNGDSGDETAAYLFECFARVVLRKLVSR